MTQVSLPLLDDEGRARVGTEFARKGRESAVELGLSLAGPQLADMLVAAKRHCCAAWQPRGVSLTATGPDSGKGLRCLVYCWRGGMRSNSVAWLLRLGGIECTVLIGGYKAFRRLAVQCLGVGPAYRDMVLDPATLDKAARPGPAYRGPKVIAVGGRTGAGKTAVLEALRSSGEQVLDLEWCANHTGSAFGGVGRGPQPSQSHFENEVYAIWAGLDPNRPVWIEDEGPHIGKSHVPDGLYDLLRAAPLIFELVVPREARLARLVSEYAGTTDTHPESPNISELQAAVAGLRKRLGGERVKRALSLLEANDFHSVAGGLDAPRCSHPVSWTPFACEGLAYPSDRFRQFFFSGVT